MIKSHNAQTAFITEDKGELYMVDHAHEKYNIDALKAYKANKITNLVDLDSGSGHFLALKVVTKPSLRDFTNEQLIEWFAEVKFSECCNLIKFGRVTGAMLYE